MPTGKNIIFQFSEETSQRIWELRFGASIQNWLYNLPSRRSLIIRGEAQWAEWLEHRSCQGLKRVSKLDQSGIHDVLQVGQANASFLIGIVSIGGEAVSCDSTLNAQPIDQELNADPQTRVSELSGSHLALFPKSAGDPTAFTPLSVTGRSVFSAIPVVGCWMRGMEPDKSRSAWTVATAEAKEGARGCLQKMDSL